MAGAHKHGLPDVSVIIVNYNVRDFLHQSLVSLQKALKGIRSEIFVIDNASDDGSAEMVRRRFPRIQLIANTAQSWFCQSKQYCLKESAR